MRCWVAMTAVHRLAGSKHNMFWMRSCADKDGGVLNRESSNGSNLEFGDMGSQSGESSMFGQVMSQYEPHMIRA